MELRHLRYFVAVAEEANFTRAAQRLGIGQPPLSQQIRALEREVGTSLFRRLPHGAELTEAGLAFLPEARATLETAARAGREARRAARGETGRLRLGFTGSATFHPQVSRSIREFRRAYPVVELALTEECTEALVGRVRRGELDAAFVWSGHDAAPDLRIEAIDEEAMVAVLPAAHPCTGQERVALADLSRDPFVLFPRAAGTVLFDEIVRACRGAGFEPRLGPEAPQIASVGNLVAAELGVSVVPPAIRRIDVADVVYRTIDGPAPLARLTLATRTDDRSAVVRNFVACALAVEVSA